MSTYTGTLTSLLERFAFQLPDRLLLVQILSQYFHTKGTISFSTSKSVLVGGLRCCWLLAAAAAVRLASAVMPTCMEVLGQYLY